MELLTSKIEERSAPTRPVNPISEGDSLIVYGKLGHVVFVGYAARLNAETIDVHTQAQRFTCLGLTIKTADYHIRNCNGWFTARPIL